MRFSCFGLEDDEGAWFGSSSLSSLSSLGLSNKEQRILPLPLQLPQLTELGVSAQGSNLSDLLIYLKGKKRVVSAKKSSFF